MRKSTLNLFRGVLSATVLFAGLPAPAEAQFFQQGPKLVGTGVSGPGAQQGASVALSADGNTAIVGGCYDSGYVGAAWVFTRNGNAWSQQGPKLVGSGFVGWGAYQGHSVALSADGNTALVGGTVDNNNTGAVWVFVRSGGVWSQQGPKLVASGAGVSTYQGWSVALSADGNTAVVGSGVGVGVWIFTRSAGVWIQQGKLTPADSVGTMTSFGSSVAISGDGYTVAVGGGHDNNQVGATWVFTRTAGQWSQQGPKLVGTGSVGPAAQGSSVALTADGNTVMTAGPDSSGAGAAWVFARTAGMWTQQGNKLTGVDSGSAWHGWLVALSGDGNTAVIGAAYSDSPVRILKRAAGVWSQQGPGLTGTAATAYSGQGNSVAISTDGNTVVTGGTGDSPVSAGGSGTSVGATWVFVRASLMVSATPQAVVGTPSPFTVMVAGPGNVAQSSYAGTLYFTSTDAQAVLPGGSRLTNGVGTFSATFKTPGLQTITANDLTTFSATSNAISVRAAAIQVSPGNLSLQYYQGTDPASATPATLTVSSDASISFSAVAADPWIALSPVSGTAPASIAVKPNPAGLSPGNYSTRITITFADGRSTNVPVSMVVYGLPQLALSSASPNPVTFTSRTDSPAVQASDITVVAQIRNVSAQVSAASSTPPGANWLLVSPASGTTPLTLHVTVNPVGLTAGTYQGRITVTSADAGNSPLSVQVTLSVLAPAPTISVLAFTNGASFIAGPGAPNTLMSAFGVLPGCTSGAQVWLDGVATSVFASTPGQINFLVPPGIAGKRTTTVRISCAGLNSDAMPLQIADQAPAVFTASANGSGQAAIVNQDGSTKPPSAPGTIVAVYGTGFGLFGSPGPDGLAHVALDVAASIGGEVATVMYAGEAPGFTSGLQQINVLIPADIPSGTQVTLQLSAGGVATQAGVTLAIQ